MVGSDADYLDYGRQIVYPKGAIIYVQRDEPTRLYLLNRGLVKLSFFSEAGAERIVTFIRPGMVFGQSAFLLEKYYGIAAIAHVDSVVTVYDRHVAKALLREHPTFAYLVATSLAQEFWYFGAQIFADSFYTSDQKVARALLTLCHQLNGHLPLRGATIEITQEELAKYTGLTRTVVNSVLRHLKAKGLITMRRKSITIEDIKKLRIWLQSDT